MPFASFNSTNPRTNPWNFHKKILRIGGVGKSAFFKSAILKFFFQKKKKFFCVFQCKQPWFSCQLSFFWKFWWLPWFSAKKHSPKHFSHQFMHKLKQALLNVLTVSYFLFMYYLFCSRLACNLNLYFNTIWFLMANYFCLPENKGYNWVQ